MKNPMHLAIGVMVAIVAGISAVMLIPQKSPNTQTSENQQQPGETAGDMNWQAYNNGIEVAKNNDKVVMVQFFATWCGYCKKMDQEVFTDEKVKDNLSKNFVSVRVTESSDSKVNYGGKDVTEKELTSLFQVSGFPTIVFLDGEGKTLSDKEGRELKIPGFVPAEEMNSILAWIGTKSYKEMDYGAFKSQASKS